MKIGRNQSLRIIYVSIYAIKYWKYGIESRRKPKVDVVVKFKQFLYAIQCLIHIFVAHSKGN